MTEVASLLERARAAHQRSHSHRGRIDKMGRIAQAPALTKAGAAIQEALSLRLEAKALDPEQQDPAWTDDVQANKGQSHQALVTFFGRYLTPTEAR